MRIRDVALRCLLLLVTVVAGASHALAERRVALVIGNSAYRHALELKNPQNDANALADALGRLGFEVVKGINLTRSRLEDTVRTFARVVRGADVALLYYAGHGLQVGGRNYLTPIDARLAKQTDLDFETVPLRLILRQMEREQRVNLVFLDACRDNPLARNLVRSMGTRSASVGRGLARVEGSVGTLIAFATQPGNVALDGTGDHSPFARALLDHIETPGLDVVLMLRRVRQQVLDETGGKQLPWSNSSLTGEFRFAVRQTGNGEKPASRPVFPPANPSVDARAVELAYWNAISGSSDVEDYRDYLRRYPQGTFSDLAKRRIARHDASKQAALAPGAAKRPAVPSDVARGIHDCDRLAAHPEDTEAVTTGVSRHSLRAPEAISACRAAVDEFPRVARFHFQLARALSKAESHKEAERSFGAAVDLGYVAAFAVLAKRYAEGNGVQKDAAKAVRLYRQGVEKGSAAAMAGLGVLYYRGSGVRRDRREAARWSRMAAENGYPRAMYNLGVMYMNGHGVRQDYREAAWWFRKAADQGVALAMYNLGVLYKDGAGVSRNQRTGAAWVFKALKAGAERGRKELTSGKAVWSKAFRRELQRLMKEEGVYDGPVDGSFGPATRRAMEALTSR